MIVMMDNVFFLQLLWNLLYCY